MKVCKQCGAVQQARGTFVGERTFWMRSVFYCPACWNKRFQRAHRQGVRTMLVVLWMLVAVGIALLIVPRLRPLGWIVLVFPAVWLSSVPLLLLHELAHALGAHLVGWRVLGISLGLGQTQWRFHFLGLPVELNGMPVCGVTWILPTGLRRYRLKWLLITFAGPAVHVAIVMALGIWIWRDYEHRRMMPNAPPLGTFLMLGVWLFTGLNLTFLVCCLTPIQMTAIYQGNVLRVPSDGLRLLTIPFMTRSALEEECESGLAQAGNAFLQHQDFESARDRFTRGLAIRSSSVANRFGLGFVHYHLKDYHACRELWLQLLREPAIPDSFRSTLYCNIAWVDLLIGGDLLLKEADAFSESAAGAEPGRPEILGTRGSVLIELGRPEEGLPLVQRALDHNQVPFLKALNACYLALGEIKRGDRERGKYYRDLACQLDPACVLLDRVDKELKAIP